MGILNVTPDSFSDGGLYSDTDAAVRRAAQMASEGAHVIDVGGESSRPGARRVSEAEEKGRVVPVIEALRERLAIPLSIDTRRASVARVALDAGCTIVNDISACRDPAMPGIIAEYGAVVVLMHMLGEPGTMQKKPSYKDVVKEVAAFLADRVELLKQAGVVGDRIVIDPGIGFGKRFRDNLELLRDVREIRSLGQPVLIGASRKTFLGEVTDAPAERRLPGSLAVAAWCHSAGVDVVRVHDVRETVDLFKVLDAIEHPDAYSADW
jgi:dihydropteroate synthase